MLAVLAALGWEAGEQQRKAVHEEREGRNREQQAERSGGGLGTGQGGHGEFRCLNQVII